MPLGVLLISGLTGLLVHERKLRMKAQKAVDDTLASCHQSRGAQTATGGYMLQDHVRPQEMECCHQSCGAQTATGGYMLQDHVRPQEMECTELQPGELYDGEVHEADVKTLNTGVDLCNRQWPFMS